MPHAERLSFPPPPCDSLVVNDRVTYRTEGTVRVISVHGIAFAHDDTTDRAAEIYAMVTLVDAGYADQNDVARAFGYDLDGLLKEHGVPLEYSIDDFEREGLTSARLWDKRQAERGSQPDH